MVDDSTMACMVTKRTATASVATIPPVHDWRTTDQDEINRRRQRAQSEPLAVANLDREQGIFANYRVRSGSGMDYTVEIRHLAERCFYCDCIDFRINGLGTCKHVEAVLLYLQARFPRKLAEARQTESPRWDIVPDSLASTLRIEKVHGHLPTALTEWFDSSGQFIGESPELALEHLSQLKISRLRIAPETFAWLENRRRSEERKQLRREYELKVQKGEWPAQETLVPLFPYQREGMLHLAFAERALLADEMGLGKTIQAIAASALLHRLNKASRVLVVTPASLKTEWEEQIQRFTTLPYQLVYGSRMYRLEAYAHPPFFTIVNYEQMLMDALDVNARLKPDIVILDEAQRIKNWDTKTAQAIKRLRSRYAFVLTGTPIENRIDELHSIMDFLDPSILGPLFRFNRDFYELDDRGRPKAYRNLGVLHKRIKPYLLRRRKADVETELPARTDRNHFVKLSDEQRARYEDHQSQIARLVAIAKRRPLTQQEQDKLLRELAMARMVCDTNYILDPQERECPKLGEMQKIFEECLADADVKIIVFSEWEKMLELVRDLCGRMKIGFAWHTGSVPQRRRRAEINAFKQDPHCRVFLSTESGGTGLNLQNASTIVNCDLPWNPAKLEQRIARAWRKNQSRPVTVVNLISENTIEHRMLETLGAKQALADGVLEAKGGLDRIPLVGGRQAFLKKLGLLLGPAPKSDDRKDSENRPLPSDRALGFCKEAIEKMGRALLCCEERFPIQGAHSVLLLVVDQDAPGWQSKLGPLHQEYFGPGKCDPLAPVRLEVIDQATRDTMARLQESGLITSAIRAARVLYPQGEIQLGPALTDEQKQKINLQKQQAARKHKMGRLLAEGGLNEEARIALLEAIHCVARSLSIEHGLPEPDELNLRALLPMSGILGEQMPAIRSYVLNVGASWKLISEILQRILTDGTKPSLLPDSAVHAGPPVL